MRSTRSADLTRIEKKTYRMNFKLLVKLLVTHACSTSRIQSQILLQQPVVQYHNSGAMVESAVQYIEHSHDSNI